MSSFEFPIINLNIRIPSNPTPSPNIHLPNLVTWFIIYILMASKQWSLPQLYYILPVVVHIVNFGIPYKEATTDIDKVFALMLSNMKGEEWKKVDIIKRFVWSD